MDYRLNMTTTSFWKRTKCLKRFYNNIEKPVMVQEHTLQQVHSVSQFLQFYSGNSYPWIPPPILFFGLIAVCDLYLWYHCRKLYLGFQVGLFWLVWKSSKIEGISVN